MLFEKYEKEESIVRKKEFLIKIIQVSGLWSEFMEYQRTNGIKSDYPQTLANFVVDRLKKKNFA